MAKKIKTPDYIPVRPFRAWREYRGMTLEAAAEEIGKWYAARGIAKGYTHNSLGRMERVGVRVPNHLLDAMAAVYQTDRGSLNREPTADSNGANAILSIWNAADPADKQKIIDIAKTIVRKDN